MNDQIPLTGEITPPPAGDLIKESTSSAFLVDVIEASRERVVLVDFWAPWCGPCKQLTPMLEKAVHAANGQVALVKINVDENQAVAGQLGVKSIPAVFAFKDGQPVDGFMGALPESEIAEFIARVAGDPEVDRSVEILEAANGALASEDYQSAAQLFAGLLQSTPENPDAIGGLARCYLAGGHPDKAAETLALAVEEDADHPAIAGARAALELAGNPELAGEVPALQAKVEADESDFQARLDLAIALNAAGDRDGATDALIEILIRKRDWNDDAARLQLLQFFEAWGQTDDATVSGRRKLSSVLFS